MLLKLIKTSGRDNMWLFLVHRTPPHPHTHTHKTFIFLFIIVGDGFLIHSELGQRIFNRFFKTLKNTHIYLEIETPHLGF